MSPALFLVIVSPEEATEATESNLSPGEGGLSHSRSQTLDLTTGIYTEHVFTDPLGVQQPPETPASYSQRWESHRMAQGVHFPTP